MRGVRWLAWRHLCFHRGRSAILVVCIALAGFLPVTVQLLVQRYDRDLRLRAAATPLVAGAAGNRFDLTLAALYFRQAELDTISDAQRRGLAAAADAIVIPVHQRFTARGRPVVGTSPEYFELRGLEPAAGSRPLRLGDALLGAAVAEQLALGPGDALFSDPTDLYDLARPPALKMAVCGVLPATGTADDEAVFVDVKTAWLLEGLLHGHDDPRDVEGNLVLAETPDLKQLSPALRAYQEVTAANARSFHLHADATQLPLSALIIVPADDKAATLLKARVNATRTWQVVAPAEVIDDLMQVVLRVKTLLDGFALVLGCSTALLLGLQLLLSMRLRAREVRTLRRIGASPGAIARLYGLEWAMLLGLGAALATLAVAVCVATVPDLVRAL